MSASLVGQKLGKYEITALVGQGGMATVYKGYQRDVDRFVAVKVLPPSPAQGKEFIERFKQEARTIARLQHPHIVPLYDYGDDDDILFLVTAYIDGGSLSDRIRRGGMSLSEVQRLFEQIAGALDYAHRQNVIHRDIKPDNILIDREGHILLADFGIAKLMEGVNTINLTGNGLVGTPAYMSPEQAQGLPIDHRTDIYSLGVVLYEMLMGKQPFEAETPMQVVLKHMTAPIPTLTGNFPPELDNVMQKALAKDATQRYFSARDFYEDFSRVLRGEESQPPPKHATQPVREAPTEMLPETATYGAPSTTVQLQPTLVGQAAWNPLVLLGGFAVIALLMVVGVALVLNTSRQPAEQPIPTTAPTVAAATALPVLSTIPNFGTVSYSTTQKLGDTADVQVKGLTPPPQGSTYRVWLYNTRTKWSLKMGDLRLDPLGNGQLSYTGDTMLPTTYDAVLVTQERGETTEPTGKVVYSGAVPVALMDALREILITSPDGLPPPAAEATEEPTDPAYASTEPAVTEEVQRPSSLLEGALEEAGIGEKHSGLAAQASSPGSLHTHAEHTINILHGTRVDYNGNGQGENPGRGYGIGYFTDKIQAKLEAAANSPDADRLIQAQVELIRVCIVNARGWMDDVVNLETQMLNVDDLTAAHPQLVQATDFASAMINGVDLNHNGQIEPFEGECGLQQIDQYGISVGNMVILEGALPGGE